jgi:hypothetical protein
MPAPCSLCGHEGEASVAARVSSASGSHTGMDESTFVDAECKAREEAEYMYARSNHRRLGWPLDPVGV